MFHKLLQSLRIRLFYKQALILLIPFVFLFTSAKAQSNNSDSSTGLSLGIDYDAPVGDLAYSYKPTLNYNINLFHKVENVTGSISFGYHLYKPKQDTFYYQVSDTEYGTISYKNFKAYSFYAGLVYDIDLSDQLRLYAGANLGAYYVIFGIRSHDFMRNGTYDYAEKEVYVAPRIGFKYALTDDVGIGIEGKYNFFATAGKADFNDRVGTLYNSYSVGIRLSYNF